MEHFAVSLAPTDALSSSSRSNLRFSQTYRDRIRIQVLRRIRFNLVAEVTDESSID